MQNIKYSNILTVDDINKLRKSVGWYEISNRQSEAIINNSAYLLTAVSDDKVIAMSRVMCDGSYAFYIADVIVDPDYQGKGIGKAMMERILEFINNKLEPGEFAFVNLMAAKDKEEFYAKLGFGIRPSENAGAGMTKFIRK